MIDRKLKNNLFLAAFDWLIKEKKVSGQKELAEKIGVSQNTITRIKHYSVTVSDETLYKMNEAFDHVFNMAYFRGESPCLLEKDLMYYQDHPEDHGWLANRIPQESTQIHTPGTIDQSSLVNAIIAAKDETIAAQRRELSKSDALIKSLQKQNAELRSRIYALEHADDLKKYPFDLGVSDPTENHQTRP